MPIYIYGCEKCGNILEIIGRFDAEFICEKCGKVMTRQVTCHAKTAGRWVV